MMRSLPIIVALLTVVAYAQDSTVAISAKRIYVGDGGVLENATMLIKGGKITALGTDVKIPEGADLQEFMGCTITPGLIDAASDAGTLESAKKLRSAAEHSSEVTPEYRTLDGVDLRSRRMLELAREGVTTVFVTGDRGSVIAAQGAVVKTGFGSSGRLLVENGDIKATMTHDPQSYGPRNTRPSGGAASLYARRPTTQMGTVWVFREAFHQARAWKQDREDARSGTNNAVSRILAEVLEGRRGIRMLAHQQHEIAMALRLASEFKIRFLLEEGTEAWRMLDQIRESGTPVIYGPVLVETGAGGKRKWSTPRRLLDAGVPLALTSVRGMGEKGLARQAMYAMRYGLTRAEALAAVTVTPASLLGVQHRVGVLKAGLDADFVVWTGEPFEPTSLQKVVYLNGQKIPGSVF